MLNILRKNMDYKNFKLAGENLKLDTRTFESHTGWNVVTNDIDDIGTIKVIRQICDVFQDNEIFVDVGAGAGMMSLMINKGICYAFEPTPYTFDILKSNIILNNKPIIAINKAVHSRKFKYKMNEQPRAGCNRVEEYDNGELTVVLDDLEFDGKVRLIKIDAEGCDLDVVKGAKKLINRDKPIIIVEGNCELIMKELNYNKVGSIGINSIYRPYRI